MLVFLLLSLFLTAPAFGQQPFGQQPTTTQQPTTQQSTGQSNLVGTWSSGSRNVVTGLGFANPLQRSFKYPPTTGISYSFTIDGFFEVARYRMSGNGTDPRCITGILNWCHGTYTVNGNGSITMYPLLDGYQQIQDPCAPISNFIEAYHDIELYIAWSIGQDIVHGTFLQLYQFDGSPLPPLWQLSTSPNMLPTQYLLNATVKSTKNPGLLIANAGERSRAVSSLTGMFPLVIALGIASLLL